MLAASVLINEIHYNPDVKTDLVEYIELYNAGDQSADLSGWQFSDGVDFEFAAGTNIPSGGFLVIAENPAAYSDEFGRTAIGPYLGKLSSDGEQVELRDAANVRQDVVDYQLGFPWPTVGDPISGAGTGHSIQLIHQSLDNDLGGSWRSAAPTPGVRNNGVISSNAAPQMRQVDHSPNQPASGDEVTITVKVTDPEGVAGVTLDYQLVEPGSYIRLTDAAYRSNWTTIVMSDDGNGGDEVAGDDVYTVLLPGSLQTHRRLVRYRITATDTLGATITGPYSDDPEPNFAYFVYDGVPDWTGSLQPGVKPNVTYSADTLGTVAVYQLIANEQDVINSQYNGSFNLRQFRATFVYDGVVYDHIEFRNRGRASTYRVGKNKWKLNFNRGHSLEARDNYGKKYDVAWDKLNILPGTNPWWRNDVSTDGTVLYEPTAFRLYELAGAPSPHTQFFQFRIIDRAQEVSSTNQYEGDFWGLYIGIEQPEHEFLEERDLPDGSIFNMHGVGGASQRTQGSLLPTGKSNLSSFVNGYKTSKPLSWWEENLNFDSYFAWNAINLAVNNSDLRPEENVNYYQDQESGRWYTIPWDLDLTFEDRPHWGRSDSAWESIHNVLNQHPVVRQMYENYVRELLDLLFDNGDAAMVVDELDFVLTAGQDTDTIVEANQAQWDYHSRTRKRGIWYANFNSSLLPNRDFDGLADYMHTFLEPGGYGRDRLAAKANDGNIPNTPTITYSGDATFPVNGLSFQSSAFGDPNGNNTFAAMEWRIAEVTDPNADDFDPTKRRKYEIEADWESGEMTSFDEAIVIPGEKIDPGDTYRVRVRMKDTSGRWSHWSEPVQFVAGASTSSPLIDGLRITEVHYNPAGLAEENDQFEFIELQNIGQQTVDLSGVSLKDGVRFQFAGSNVTSLNPGEFVLVVRNQAEFQARYGMGMSDIIAGEYAGKLQNDGEDFELVDVAQGILQEVDYKDGWYDLTDGEGFSLSRVDLGDPLVDANLSDSAAWRPSSALHGSPGEADTFSVPAPGSIVVNEVLAHSNTPDGDWIELLNTTTSPIDISGWFLSDDRLDPLKYEIDAGTIIAAGGFAIFTQFTPWPQIQPFGDAFALSELGDEVIVQAADAAGAMLGFRAREDFGASENGVTLGRFIKTTGGKDFVAMIEATPGTTNSGPLIGPVVIHEVMYNPGAGDGNGGGSEFVELINISGVPVSLEGWHFGAIDYTFGAEATIEPGGLVVVVPTTPAEFRATHNVPDDARVFGPYLGALKNGGESLRLNKPGKPEIIPGDPDVIFIPSIMVDRVSYKDKAPWPIEADGTGPALQRIVPETYGNEPTNWGVSVPGGTPGDFLILPTVNEVLVSAVGPGESSFSIPAGIAQLQTIASTNVEQISLRFSEHVEVTSADLRVAGVNVHKYDIVGFAYNRQALTATWTLDRPVAADKLLVELSDNVRDASGLPLDGNWTDAVSSFPSGNGAIDSSDAFQFRINVVPGDITADGSVDRADLVDLIHHLGDSSTTLRRDLNGDGRVDVFDLRAALLRLGSGLPSTEPNPPASTAPQAAVDVVFSRVGGGAGNNLVAPDRNHSSREATAMIHADSVSSQPAGESSAALRRRGASRRWMSVVPINADDLNEITDSTRISRRRAISRR